MQEKECTKLIPKIYKRNAENMMLYAWVNAQKKAVPTITIVQSIRSYIAYFDIDDWDIESAMATYTRMQKEYHKG